MKDVISLGLIACAAFASNVNASAYDALRDPDDVTMEVVIAHLHTDCRFQVEKTFDMANLGSDESLFEYNLQIEQCVGKLVQKPGYVKKYMTDMQQWIKDQNYPK